MRHANYRLAANDYGVGELGQRIIRAHPELQRAFDWQFAVIEQVRSHRAQRVASV